METPGPAVTDQLEGLRIDCLRRALDLYLAHAYPSGSYPEAVRRRIDWPADAKPSVLLTHAPFERVGREDRGNSSVFALRLGNARYPHMKLQIQPWPNDAGFMLSVNTHDQVLAIDPNSADAQAFRDLQAENQRLKEVIEAAWDQAGLPTFLSYLRRYIQDRVEGAEPGPEAPPTIGAEGEGPKPRP